MAAVVKIEGKLSAPEEPFAGLADLKIFAGFWRPQAPPRAIVVINHAVPRIEG